MKSINFQRFLAGGIGVLLVLMAGPLLWRRAVGAHTLAADRRLIDAIRHNDTAAVKAALQAGADPNAEMEGWAWTDFVHPLVNALQGDMKQHLRDTPLLLTMDSTVKREVKAVTAHNQDIPLENLGAVQALVAAGASVNARSSIGQTPLQTAVSWGYYDTAHYLLEHKADPNIAEVCGLTALHFAVSGGNTKLVKDLLDHGANPNTPDMSGMTPLFWAAVPPETPQQVQVVKLLLQYHADPTLKDHAGLTALAHAQQDRRAGIVKLLK